MDWAHSLTSNGGAFRPAPSRSCSTDYWWKPCSSKCIARGLTNVFSQRRAGRKHTFHLSGRHVSPGRLVAAGIALSRIYDWPKQFRLSTASLDTGPRRRSVAGESPCVVPSRLRNFLCWPFSERDRAEPQPKLLGPLGWLQILGGGKKGAIMANVFGATSITKRVLSGANLHGKRILVAH